MVLTESLNVQQFRVDYLDMLPTSPEHFTKDNARWTDVVSAAESIDLRLARMPSQFGGRWRGYNTSQPTQAGKATVPDHYDDIQVAKVWNQQRSTRIALHEILLEICGQFQILHPVRDYTALERLRQWSMGIIASMCSEICASIPFHLRRSGTDGKKSLSDAQQAAGACALIWPLETIAKCQYNSESHRRIARDTLEEIGSTIGVREATRKLAECLATRPADSHV